MDLTIVLNGIKYLIVEVLATDANKEKLTSKLKRHNAIYQGIKDIKVGGFWSNTYAVIKILVPEGNIIAFNNDDN